MSSSPIIVPGPLPAILSEEPMILWSISAAQKKFLSEWAPGYKSAFTKKALLDFWPILFVEWFKEWPENTEEREFVEEQLKLWLLNNNKWQLNTAQKKYLQDLLPDYKTYQASKKLPDFWARLFAEWFQHWPAAETAPQPLVETKLKSWFNNNTRVTTNARQVLNLNQPPKRTRHPAIYQTFCQVWWRKTLPDGTVLRRVVQDEWTQEYKKRPSYDPKLPIPRIPVTFINAVSKRIFFQQSAALQADILQRYENMKVEQTEEDAEGVDDADVAAARARDFQMGIDSLPYSLEQAGQQILEHTGFISLTLVAGPEPSQGGNIVVYCLTHGSTARGCDFTQFCKTFGKTIEAPFADFAKIVFLPEERLKRALPGSKHLCNYDITTPAPPPPPPSQVFNGTINPHLLMARRQSVGVEADDGKSDVDNDISDDEFATPTPPSGLNKARLQLNSSAGEVTDAGTVGTLDASANVEDMPDTVATTDETINPGAEAIISNIEPAAPLANCTPSADIDIYSVCPTDAPLWLQAAVPYLLGHSKDPRWKTLVEQFATFERSLGYLDGKISSQILTIGKNRPKEMTAWIKSARVINPVIKSSLNFGQQWSYWYYDLQPTARKNGPDGLLQRVVPNNDWSELCKGTINGVYGLMVSLGWWLGAAEANGDCQEALTKALEDFEWALESMVRANGSKRKSPDSDNTEQPSKKSRTA